MKKFHSITLSAKEYPGLSEKIESYESVIVYEGELEESEIDEKLGELSYCGGDLGDDSIQKLELLIESQGKKIYFSDLDEAKDFQKYLLEVHQIRKDLSEVESKDWSEEWKKHYERIDLGYKNLSIVPSWEKTENKKEEIYIYPGQGFGTGTHETTRLCLKILKGLEDQEVKEVLDFGCGSGILGIGHQKIYSSKVCYFDIEEAAMENTRVNIDLNEISLRDCHVLMPNEKERIKDKSYDLVFSNILKNVLLLESAFLNELNCKNLILSGILVGQEAEIISHFNDLNYENSLMMVDGDWVALLMKKK